MLIVGAGPVGLALAGDLGWRGIPCVLVERGDGIIDQPRMDMVGIRTMEFCRRWGIVLWVERAGYNRDYPQDCAWVTSLNGGYELGREPFPAPRDEPVPPQSPQKRERCPQHFFDPVLARLTAQYPHVTVRYRTELTRFEDRAEGVSATVIDVASGKEETVACDYLVGCDGGASNIRGALEIPVALRNVAEASGNLKRMLSPRDLVPPGEIFEPGAEGDAARVEFGATYTRVMGREWHTNGIHLGYRYEGSPVIVPDGTPEPEDSVSDCVQTARPGHRAPHVWLGAGRSTLDCFGKRLVLMRFDESAAMDRIERAAEARGVPLTVVDIAQREARELYQRRLVLVRPDGHCAWRADEQPGDAAGVIATVCGAG